jgi:AcrR family transcriptional regulator
MAGTKKADSGEKDRKADITRRKIMAAARRVFAEYPYHSASVRMIGSAGRFNHALIRYHFPSKASLFEAVLTEICEEIYGVNLELLEGLEGLSPEEGFSRYLDRFLDHHFRHPTALRIVMLNLAMTRRPETLPGYLQIPGMLGRTRETFEQLIPPKNRTDDVRRFLYSFNNLVLNLLGASACQAKILDMNPAGPEYREWVKRTLMLMFLPGLKAFLEE